MGSLCLPWHRSEELQKPIFSAVLDGGVALYMMSANLFISILFSLNLNGPRFQQGQPLTPLVRMC